MPCDGDWYIGQVQSELCHILTFGKTIPTLGDRTSPTTIRTIINARIFVCVTNVYILFNVTQLLCMVVSKYTFNVYMLCCLCLLCAHCLS